MSSVALAKEDVESAGWQRTRNGAASLRQISFRSGKKYVRRSLGESGPSAFQRRVAYFLPSGYSRPALVFSPGIHYGIPAFRNSMPTSRNPILTPEQCGQIIANLESCIALFDNKQGMLTGAEIRAQNMLKVLRNDIVQGMPKHEPASEA